MARKITYVFETPFANKSDDDEGEMEFPDGTTHEQVEAAIREEFFERYNYGWSDTP